MLRKFLLILLALALLAACEAAFDPVDSSDDSSLTDSSSAGSNSSPSGKYLGLENGTMALFDEKIADYAQYLNLDPSVPTVTGLYYANGVYLAVAKNRAMYVSKDLQEWKETEQKTGKIFSILTDPPRGFLLINDNKYYASTDGETWEWIKGIEKFFPKTNSYGEAYKPDVFFKNTIIGCGWDAIVPKTKKFGKYTANYQKKYYSLANDGEVLFGVTGANGEYVPDKIHVSFDGIKWKSTSLTTRNGYNNLIKIMPQYDDKSIIKIYTYNCEDTYTYYSYEVKNNIVLLQEEEKLQYFKGDLTPEKGFFNLCARLMKIWDDSEGRRYLNTGIYGESFEKLGFRNDILLLQDFIGNPTTDKVASSTIANGKFYYFGKYGGIIEIDNKFNQRWVGLYPREPLSRKAMADAAVGGILGIVEKNGILWYGNRKLIEYNRYSGSAVDGCKVYSSADGVNWNYEFTDESLKVPVEKLVRN